MRIAGTIPGPCGLHAAVLLVVPLASVLFGHEVPAAARETTGTAVATQECRLNIEGRAIQRVTLVGVGEKETSIERSGKSTPLPAGKYRVQQVELKGAFPAASTLPATTTGFTSRRAGRRC